MNCTHYWMTMNYKDGYICTRCGDITDELFSKEQFDKEWLFHQNFLVDVCSVLHLDFCVESESSILEKLRLVTATIPNLTDNQKPLNQSE